MDEFLIHLVGAVVGGSIGGYFAFMWGFNHIGRHIFHTSMTTYTYIMEKLDHGAQVENPQQNMSYDDLFDFFTRCYGDTFTKRTRLQSRKADCIMFLAENLDHIDSQLGRIYSSIGPHRYEWSIDDFVFIRLRRDANGNYEHSSAGAGECNKQPL